MSKKEVDLRSGERSASRKKVELAGRQALICAASREDVVTRPAFDAFHLMLLSLLVASPGGGDLATVDVPVLVREDAHLARAKEPVTCGVPLRRAAQVRDVASLALLGSDGRTPVPAQLRVLARYDAPASDSRAPISWLAVDFDASIPAKGEAILHLREAVEKPGEIAKLREEILIREDAERLVVDTGVARFTIPKGRLALLDQVELAGARPEDPPRSALRAPAEIGISPGRERSSIYSGASASGVAVDVVERGPIRATVRLSGRLAMGSAAPAYPGALDYLEIDARLRFQAGSARLRADIVVRNPDKSVTGDAHVGGKQVDQRFQEIALRMPLALRGEVTVACPELKSPLRLRQGERFTLHQDGSGGPRAGPAKDGCPEFASTFNGFRARRDGDPTRKPSREGAAADGGVLAEGRRADGVVAFADERIAFGVGVRDFWQAFPKSIRLGADGLVEVGLWPGEWSVLHRLRGGVQKTHRLVIDFRRAETGSASAALASVQAMTLAPLVGTSTPEGVRDSEGLGWISTFDPERFRWYETAALAVVAYNAALGKDAARQGDLFREMEDKDEYGWMHYGDHYREGSKSLRYWGNNELDFGLCLLLQWIRNSDRDRRFFDSGEAAIRHLIDVDIYHTDRDLFWANHGVRKHDASGTVDHSRAPNLSHLWTGGLMTYALVTADDSSRDALLEIGGWLKARERDPKGKPGLLAFGGEVRSRGWAIQAMLDLYRVTGDASWLDFAGRVSRAMVSGWMAPDGLLPNSQKSVDPWMAGYVSEELGRYLIISGDRGEKDADAEQALRRLLDAIAGRAWIREAGTVAYTLHPDGSKPPVLSPNLSATQCDGFAYGFELFGKPLYIRMAKSCFESGRDPRHYPYYYSTTLSTPAKNAGFKLRFGQAWMRLVQRIEADREPPEIASALVVEAELGDRSAVVRFETREAARARATIAGPGSPRVSADGSFSAGDHRVTLEALEPDSEYVLTL